MSTIISRPQLRKVLFTVWTTMSSLLFVCLLIREWERGEKNEYFNTAGLAPSIGLRLGARMAQLWGSAHANVMLPLLQGAVISRHWWMAAPGYVAGDAVVLCPAPGRAAQLFLEWHWRALTELGVGDSSVPFCCLGLSPYKGLSEGLSGIMEDSLQPWLWSHPWVSFATPLL